MRISARGRYALAATISMAARYTTGENITVISLSERLGISKIYLEQVFSLLKKAEIVCSQKGAQGGYRLARAPEEITALGVLEATDLSLFETAGDTVPERAPELEATLQETVFGAVETAVRDTLQTLTLRRLVDDAKQRRGPQSYMFYI